MPAAQMRRTSNPDRVLFLQMGHLLIVLTAIGDVNGA